MKITKEGITLDRELSELDKFAIEFSQIIEKNTKYVIVSGYVSILLGRARASEDIDMLIAPITNAEWKKMYNDLTKKGYYCINADEKISYENIKDGIAVRFAPKNSVIPNMEILFTKEKSQIMALTTRIPVFINKKKIFVSNLELQIAYKEKKLGSPKDIEDARHLRLLLGSSLNKRKLNEYERMLNEG